MDARALHADARADRVDVVVARGDRDLGAGAGLARDGLHLHDALVDLGDLGLEELLDQAGVAAGENDLGPRALAVDLLDVRDDAVTGAVGLARGLLAVWEHRLGATEVDDDVVAALEAANDAANELALAVLVLVVDEISLGIAEALDEHLLRGLRGDAPELRALHLDLEDLAELFVLLTSPLEVLREVEDLEAELLAELRLEARLLRLVEGDLARGLGDLGLDDRHVHEEVDLAGLVGELRFELAVLAERVLRGLEDGLFHRLHEDLAVDALFLGDRVDHRRERDVAARRSLRSVHHRSCSESRLPFAFAPGFFPLPGLILGAGS